MKERNQIIISIKMTIVHEVHHLYSHLRIQGESPPLSKENDQ